MRAVPDTWIAGLDDSLLVLGTYRGTERATERPIDAAFAHHWTVAGDCVMSLRQYTDSAAWLGVPA